jgi:hypothetical protein
MTGSGGELPIPAAVSNSWDEDDHDGQSRRSSATRQQRAVTGNVLSGPPGSVRGAHPLPGPPPELVEWLNAELRRIAELRARGSANLAVGHWGRGQPVPGFRTAPRVMLPRVAIIRRD